MRKYLIVGLLAAFMSSEPSSSYGQESCVANRMTKATVYAPLYSHIYVGDKLMPFNLAATVSVRNTDPERSLQIVRAEYHDSAGALLRSSLTAPITLPPLASHAFKIKESDVEGGSGASFIIKWEASGAVSSPIIETVMIGAASAQGISFTSRAKVISYE